MPRHTATLSLLVLVFAAEAAVVLDLSVRRTSQRSAALQMPGIGSHAVASPHAAPTAAAAPCPPPRPSPGTVVLVEAIVDERGQVESACVVLSVSPAFDGRALRFVRDQRYEPAIHNGKPVKVFLNVSVFAHPQ